MEWGAEPQPFLHSPEHSYMSHITIPKPAAVLVQDWLPALNRELQLKSRGQSSGLSEGRVSDKRQRSFSSSCVLSCCRMIRQSSLSRFPSHSLSLLSGAQTFCNRDYTMKEGPYNYWDPVSAGLADNITRQIAPLLPWR